MPSNEAAIFEITGVGGADNFAEIAGLWETSPGDSAVGAVAFSPTAEPETSLPVWRVNLPSDPVAAEAAFANASRQLEGTEMALSTAETRMDALVERRTAPVSFDSSVTGRGIAEPETELLGLLQEAQYGRQSVSFSVDDETGRGRWETALEEFRAFSDRVQQILSHFAVVETQIEGSLLARSTVSWTGDFQTAWGADLAAEQFKLHRQTLTTALLSRLVMFRTMIVITTGAGKLSVLLTAPGGAILALPAAWKFIKQIRAELAKLAPEMA